MPVTVTTSSPTLKHWCLFVFLGINRGVTPLFLQVVVSYISSSLAILVRCPLTLLVYLIFLAIQCRNEEYRTLVRRHLTRPRFHIDMLLMGACQQALPFVLFGWLVQLCASGALSGGRLSSASGGVLFASTPLLAVAFQRLLQSSWMKLLISSLVRSQHEASTPAASFSEKKLHLTLDTIPSSSRSTSTDSITPRRYSLEMEISGVQQTSSQPISSELGVPSEPIVVVEDLIEPIGDAAQPDEVNPFERTTDTCSESGEDNVSTIAASTTSTSVVPSPDRPFAVVGMVIGQLGVALVLAQDIMNNSSSSLVAALIGVAVAFIGIALWAGSSIYWSSRKSDIPCTLVGLSSNAYSAPVSLICWLIQLYASPDGNTRRDLDWSSVDTRFWLALIYIAIGSGFVASQLLYYLFATMGPIRANQVLYLVPVVAMFADVIVHDRWSHQASGWIIMQCSGVLIVILGLYLTTLTPRRQTTCTPMRDGELKSVQLVTVTIK